MSHRFYVETAITSDRAGLSGPEAHHLIHVMRGQVGDEVVLFDGSGWEFTAQVIGLKRASAELAVLAGQEVDRELSFRLTLGVALPKGDRQRWLIEKAVELGVGRVVPLETTRGVAQPFKGSLERLRRTVVEASKQCGRNRLLEIAPPLPLADFFQSASTKALRLVAHPARSACPVAQVLNGWQGGEVVLAVGPEGGFTDEEVTIAAGWQTVSLGSRILRIETAAITLAATFSLTTQGES